MIRQYLQNHVVSKLQLGCGPFLKEGWLNSDKSVDIWKLGAIYMDVSKRFPLPDSCIDFVYSEHLFEHLKMPAATNMLKECHRVMKTNGVLRIATPNIEFLVDLYLHPEKEINKRYIDWASEQGKIPASPVYVINRFHTTWGHQIIYDYKSLAQMLESCGFKDVIRCKMSQSEHPALVGLEEHFNNMPYDFCCLETMILEARKR